MNMAALRNSSPMDSAVGQYIPLDNGDRVVVVSEDSRGKQTADTCPEHHRMLAVHDFSPFWRQPTGLASG